MLPDYLSVSDDYGYTKMSVMQYINLPTRIKNQSEIPINNIFYAKINPKPTVGMFTTSIFDHLMLFFKDLVDLHPLLAIMNNNQLGTATKVLIRNTLEMIWLEVTGTKCFTDTRLM